MFKTIRIMNETKLQARRKHVLRWAAGLALAALEFQAIYSVLLEVD